MRGSARRFFRKLLSCFISGAILFTPIVPAEARGSAKESRLARLGSPFLSGKVSRALNRSDGLPIPVPVLSAQAASVPATGVPAWLRPLSEASVDIRDVRLAAPSNAAKIVFHFQDVHEQADAQRHVAEALRLLAAAQEGGFLVGLEGAAGSFRVEPYRRLPDPSVRRDIADVLLAKGLLSGPEYAAIIADQPPALWGLEDPVLYRNHVNAFQSAVPYELSIASQVSAAQKSIEELIRRVGSAGLIEGYQRRSVFRRDGSGLGDYVEFLIGGASVADFPQIELFQQALRIEKSLEFDRVEKERTLALRELSARLSSAELASLAAAALQCRLGRTPYSRFYAELSETAFRRGLSLAEKFPLLDAYARYVALAERIDPDAFHHELAAMEATVFSRLARGAAERESIRLADDAALLAGLVGRTLDETGWRTYVRRGGDIRRLPERLTRLRRENGFSEGARLSLTNIGLFESFYAAAERRNDALVDNLLSRMDQTGVSAAALVAGGFHTPGLSRRLRERGVTFAVVSPRFQPGEGAAYLDFFRRARTPLEKLFHGEKLALKHTQALAETPLIGRQSPLAAAVEGAYISLGSLASAVKELDRLASLSSADRRRFVEWAAGFGTVERVLARGLETEISADGRALERATFELEFRSPGARPRRVRAEWIRPGADSPVSSAAFEAAGPLGTFRIHEARPSGIARLGHPIQAARERVRALLTPARPATEEAGLPAAETLVPALRQILSDSGIEIDNGTLQVLTDAAKRANALHLLPGLGGSRLRGGIPIHISVSEDLSRLVYSRVLDDSSVFGEDGSSDFSKLRLEKIVEIPSSFLLFPVTWIAKNLRHEILENVMQLMMRNQRYTTYDGITVSWDKQVDRDVWTTNIDTVYLHRTLKQAGLLNDPSFRTATEIGTGGGHLAALMARDVPNLEELRITDISAFALMASARNVRPYLKNGAALKAYLGKGIRALDNRSDLILVNPPYIPTPPWEAQTEGDPYRGTGLIREIFEIGVDRLNPENPNASIIMNVSNVADADIEEYKRLYGGRLLIEEIGDPLWVPMKIGAVEPRWLDWLKSRGLVEKADPRPDEARHWHNLRVLRIRPGGASAHPVSPERSAEQFRRDRKDIVNGSDLPGATRALLPSADPSTSGPGVRGVRYAAWSALVAAWNFGFPHVAPIADVAAAVLFGAFAKVIPNRIRLPVAGFLPGLDSLSLLRRSLNAEFAGKEYQARLSATSEAQTLRITRNGRAAAELNLRPDIRVAGAEQETFRFVGARRRNGREIVLRFVPSDAANSPWKTQDVHVVFSSGGAEVFTRAVPKGAVRIGKTAAFAGSIAGFERVFSPQANLDDRRATRADEAAVVTAQGGWDRGGQWMFTPPPLAFGFELSEGDWMTAGLAVRPGHYNFNAFSYDGAPGGRFGFSQDFGGREVAGPRGWESPRILFGFSKDPYQGIEQYVDVLMRRGLVNRPRPHEDAPEWWKRLIFTGWGAQHADSSDQTGVLPPELLSIKGTAELCTQENYEKWLRRLEEQKINPGSVIIDDKWSTYDSFEVDAEKWPDMRGFIAGQHAKDRRVLLWLGLWKSEGNLRDEDGNVIPMDPTDPRFVERLRARVRYLLSPEGLNADGFKVDWTQHIPPIDQAMHDPNVGGIELLRRYMEIIYETAKETKPDALIIAHEANPYFLDVVDMLRLNDLRGNEADVLDTMTHRAKIAAAAGFNLFDPDNWPITEPLSFYRYFVNQKNLFDGSSDKYISHSLYYVDGLPAYGRKGKVSLQRFIPKVSAYLARHSETEQRIEAVWQKHAERFGKQPSVLALGPGRANIIGEHVDYPVFPEDGSARNYSLAYALPFNVLVSARKRDDDRVRLYSVDLDQTYEFRLGELERMASRAERDPAFLERLRSKRLWAGYALGIYLQAKREGFPLSGAEFTIQGNVPLGAGLSSSAGYAVALTLAAKDIYGWPLPNVWHQARMARFGEANPFVGAHVGLLDQTASLAGDEDTAVLIDYGDLRNRKSVSFDLGDRAFVLVNSNVSRRLAKTDYNTRVEELQQVPAVMNRLLRARNPSHRDKSHVSAFSWKEFVSVAAEFQQAEPTLFKRARHVLTERQRTLDLFRALEKGDVEEVGRLLDASGDSLSMEGDFQISGTVDGIGNALDALVAAGRKHGAHGRMMGGGGGGSAIFLVKKSKLAKWKERVAREYEAATGLKPDFYDAPPVGGARVVRRRSETDRGATALFRASTLVDFGQNVSSRLAAVEKLFSPVSGLKAPESLPGAAPDTTSFRVEPRAPQEVLTSPVRLAGAEPAPRPSSPVRLLRRLGFRTIRNPLLADDFSGMLYGYGDPAALKAGDYYYVAATSNNAADAGPILRSRDLVSWEFVNFIFPEGRRPAWHSADPDTYEFWAPEIYSIGDRYATFYTARDRTGQLCIGAAFADSLDGPWSDLGRPFIRDEGVGLIDAHLFRDPVSGHFILYWKTDGNDPAVAEPTVIRARRIAFRPNGPAFLGDMKEVLRNDQEWEGDVVEGPAVVYRNGWYYILYSGNDYSTENYAIGVARSRSPFGPFEKRPEPVLRGNEDFKSPGHGSVVEAWDGVTDLYVYHAYPRGGAGWRKSRLLMADPIRWTDDGWLEIGEAGTPTRREQHLFRSFFGLVPRLRSAFSSVGKERAVSSPIESGDAEISPLHEISLSGGDWTLRPAAGPDWVGRGLADAAAPDSQSGNAPADVALETADAVPARVPGGVQNALANAGRIPDPYVDRNTFASEWVSQRGWVFRKSFVVDSSLRGRRIRLDLDGIDYEGEIYLNGEKLGAHRGLYTPARFEVQDKLRYGQENILLVALEPAPEGQAMTGRTDRVKTTKPRMNYGWDFSPRALQIGLMKDVRLKVTGPARIEDLHVRPSIEEVQGSVEVTATVSSSKAIPVIIETTIKHRGETVVQRRDPADLDPGETVLRQTVSVPNPRLWWPNGMGDQPLYEVETRVVVADRGGAVESDAQTHTVGFRRIRLVENTAAEPSARPYTFEVNGRRTYAKGWNWVPMDIQYGDARPEKLERLFELAKRANVNLLRVWGGGLVESEAFYDLADRHGIMVWQEFPQSGSDQNRTPSSDPAFVRLMEQEARHAILSRRNHPSLAMWGGGNELTLANDDDLDVTALPVIRRLEDLVRTLDPDRAWVPTSPTGRKYYNNLANIADDPDGLHDVHGPWSHQGLEDQYTLYNAGTSLFSSEFGAEGMADMKTIASAISPEKRWPADKSNLMYDHRSNNVPFLESVFGAFRRLTDLQRASQFMQAEGLRYAVESNVRRWPRNSGVAPWQYNEPYPNSFSWAAVDFSGEPKSAYYAVARSFAPVTVTARVDRQAWAGHAAFNAEVFVTNTTDVRYPDVNVVARVVGADGKIHSEFTRSGAVPVNSGADVLSLSVPLADVDTEIFFLDLRIVGDNGERIAANRYLFSKGKDLTALRGLPRAKVQARFDGSTLVLENTGSVAAVDVRLDAAASGAAYFSDNRFTLLPGETREIGVAWPDVPADECRLVVDAWNLPAVSLSQRSFRFRWRNPLRPAGNRIRPEAGPSPAQERPSGAEDSALPLPIRLSETDLSSLLAAARAPAQDAADDFRTRSDFLSLLAVFSGQTGFRLPRAALDSLSAEIRDEIARELKPAFFLDYRSLETRAARAARRMIRSQTEKVGERRRQALRRELDRLFAGPSGTDFASRVVASIEKMGRNHGLEASGGGRSVERLLEEEAEPTLRALAKRWTAEGGDVQDDLAAAWRDLYREAFEQGASSARIREASAAHEDALQGEDWTIAAFDTASLPLTASPDRNPVYEQLAALLKTHRQSEAKIESHSEGDGDEQGMRNQSRLFLPLYVDSFGDPAGGVEKRTFAALLSYLDRRGHFDAALHLRGMMREGRAVVVTGHDLGLARGQPVSPEALRDYVEKRYLSDGKVSVFSLFTADALRWSEEWRSSVRFKLLVILSESQVVEVIGDLENSLKALRLMQIQA